MRRGQARRRRSEPDGGVNAGRDKGLHYGPTPAHDPLGPVQVKRVIDAVFQTLREVGVEFEPDPKIQGLFRDAGCDVEENGLVKFPTELVRDALGGMARSVKLWNRPGTEYIEIDNRHTWFISGMTCIKVYDELTGEPRDSNRSDLATATRVADALPNIDAVTISCKNVEHSDIFGEIDEFSVLAENTTKPLEYLCEYPESLGVVIDMAAAVRGGHRRLAEKPYFMHIVTPLPLYFTRVHTDQIVRAVEAGVPVGLGTVCIGGASAPITIAGCLVHSLATDFAGMVLGQLVRTGAFCIGGSDASFMEAATGGIGSFTQSSLADMAICQVARELDYPSLTGIGGCSVARRFNQDAVWEISSNMTQTYMSRPATVDYVGSIDEGITYSLHALLFCDELAGMLRRMWEGIAIDDDMLAMDLTLQEGPRGNYLANPHTAEHCRTESWSAKYFGSNLPVSTSSNPDADLIERIDRELQDILQTHRPDPLDPDVLQQMNNLQREFRAAHTTVA